jgi:hypothetical protein
MASSNNDASSREAKLDLAMIELAYVGDLNEGWVAALALLLATLEIEE